MKIGVRQLIVAHKACEAAKIALERAWQKERDAIRIERFHAGIAWEKLREKEKKKKRE